MILCVEVSIQSLSTGGLCPQANAGEVPYLEYLAQFDEIRRLFYNAYLSPAAAQMKRSDVAPQPWEQTASTVTVMANPDGVELDGLRGLNVSDSCLPATPV